MIRYEKKNLIDGRIDGRLFLAGNGAADHPKDVAGDKEYNRVCREYELKGGDSMELLQAYLDKYPDSRHKNRVLSLIASAYFMEENTRRPLPCSGRVIWRLCLIRKEMIVPCVWPPLI